MFHEIRFPTNISFGSAGGPVRLTEIVTLANGFEERNTPWADSRRRYDAGIGMRSLADVDALIAFFEARSGQLYGFRWKDWSDFHSCGSLEDVGFEDQEVATADGVTTAFQLVKTYVSGAQKYRRFIHKPVAGSVRIGVQGIELIEGVDFSVDSETGIVQFTTAPTSGEIITAGYEFDVPVRFDTDSIQTSVGSFNAGDIPNVPIVEVRI